MTSNNYSKNKKNKPLPKTLNVKDKGNGGYLNYHNMRVASIGGPVKELGPKTKKI